MTEGFVVDASVAISWVVRSQASEQTAKLLEKVAAGMALVVPGHWALEIANALVVLERKRRIPPGDRRRALHALSLLPVEVDLQSTNYAFSSVAEMASTHRLSVYDAAYLDLALRHGIPLATRDRRLLEVSESLGVKLL